MEYIGVITHLLAINPNFLGHPSVCLLSSVALFSASSKMVAFLKPSTNRKGKHLQVSQTGHIIYMLHMYIYTDILMASQPTTPTPNVPPSQK